MQLVHLDVNLPESNARQTVGPLSSGLNAIYGPRGSGKSRLVRWLRQVTAETYGPEYVPNLHNKQLDLTGEVELRNHGTPLRFSRDSYGRVTNTLSSNNGYRPATTTLTRDLSARQRQAFTLLADVSLQSDTEIALEDVARRLGLETRVDDTRANERDTLVARERDLLTRLDLVQRTPTTREELVARRRDVEHKLDSMRQLWGRKNYDGTIDRTRMLDRFAAIEADLHGAEAEIQQLDGEIAKVKAELKQSEIGQLSVDVEPSYRQQLQQLEDRLTRWRKTLRDLKAHRETIEQDETEAHLDEQVGTQLSGTLHADARAPMRSLEAQLHHARKQLDQLIYQYWPTNSSPVNIAPVVDPRAIDPRAIDPRTVDPRVRAIDPRTIAGGYQVQRDAYGRTHISYDTAATTQFDTAQLPEMLRSMQRDLHDLCHQMSRQEAATTATSLKQQAQQLRRCETELLQSVEKLIEERGVLLRKVADRYNLTSEQLSLTFGDWCQCNDHPHLYDWLVKEEAPRKLTRENDGELRSRFEETLVRLDAQRREAALRAEECRRQLRDANRLRVSAHSQPVVDNRQAEEAELLRELDLLTRQLADLESRDRLVAELDEVRRLLSRTPAYVATNSEYLAAVDRNVVGLSGTLYHRSPLTTAEYATSRQYDTFNGVVTEQPAYRHQFEVPSAIVRTAQRVSIGQLLAARGDAIPVVLDQTLDGLDARLQQAAISHLALVSQGLQIVVLTDNSHVAELVRQHRGNVVTLQNVSVVKRDKDINRQLIGFANDEEASKWYHPTIDPLLRRNNREYYLEENSVIDQHPAIGSELSARCRKLGIAMIGDLLDVDPAWLANNLRIAGIDAGRIANWQSAAELLCSVRNLRPFDARVLVGAGVRSAAQLSAMNPTQLVDNVEAFLATETGRKILQTGNSFEHSRIRNWISAARNNRNGNGYVRTPRPELNGYEHDDLNHQGGRNNSRHDFSREYETRQREPRDSGQRRPAQDEAPRFYDEQPESRGIRPERIARPKREARTQRAPRQDRPERGEREPREIRPERNDPAYPAVVDNDRSSAQRTGSRNGNQSSRNSGNGSAAKFYLELASAVEDAPSIGDRMAERLNTVGVLIVEQLLAANPDSLANKLNNRKVTAEIIRNWQDQARLVCRIPFLRGRDAQLLVGCGVTTPEALRGISAESILSKVTAYARTSEGQRILRGSKEPDLAEVHDWLNWSNQTRSLNAA
jgi:energy-coupling factor transporter ATP-binding protein EcfA2